MANGTVSLIGTSVGHVSSSLTPSKHLQGLIQDCSVLSHMWALCDLFLWSQLKCFGLQRLIHHTNTKMLCLDPFRWLFSPKCFPGETAGSCWFDWHFLFISQSVLKGHTTTHCGGYFRCKKHLVLD